MSSILPFVVVAALLAIGASVALSAADQPATDGERPTRDPLWPRIVDRVGRARIAVVAWLGRRRERRQLRRAQRAQEQAEARAAEATRSDASDVPSKDSEPGAPSATRVLAPPPPVDGVVTTALRVKPDPSTTDTAGDPIPTTKPGFLVRLRSAIGLGLLIVVLGLALAAVLGAIIAAAGTALDGFVN